MPFSSSISYQLSRQIIENATEYAIFTLNAEGVILSWSPGAVRVFGYEAEEAIGMDFADLFVEADKAAHAPQMELQKAFMDERAEDTRWHVRKGGERFWANGVTMRLRDEPGLVKVVRDETPSRIAEDRRILLLNELNHRLKNTLATVQSIADQTLRSHDVAAGVRDVLTDRLMSLSEAHNVLVEQNWAGADLNVIVDRALAPHLSPASPRFLVDGPQVRLSPQQAVAISLALHELCTNAIKYGALSSLDGVVHISWNISHEADGTRRMTLLWREEGGPRVQPPSREGFGTRLIRRSFGLEAGGEARLDYLPEGVRCVFVVNLTGSDGAVLMVVAGDPAVPL